MLCQIEPHNRLRRISKLCAGICLAMVASLTLPACGIDDSASIATQSDGSANMSFSPPSPVLALRAVDRDQLQLTVRVNGQEITTTRESQDNWVATTTVQPGTTITAEVIWMLQGLEIARANKEVSVSSEGASVSFASSEFNTTMDKDSDGFSNLDEFDAGTNPRDGNSSPGQVLNDVSLVVKFELPQELENASPSSIATLIVEASVNDQGIAVTRNGNVWSSDASVSAGSSAFVKVVFYSEQPRLPLAEFQGSESAGSGGTITINAGAYETENFDNNYDAVSNAEEFVGGSEAEDTDSEPSDTDSEPSDTGSEPSDTDSEPSDTDSEPSDTDAAAACAISNFESGCDEDSDEDGIPDSVEGETDDTDRDSIPDYLESNTIDQDEDGAYAYDDQDDVNDPCTPSNRVDACVLQWRDFDGDGPTDVEEGYLLNPQPDFDGDEIPDWRESSDEADDPDGDGVANQFDPANDNPCKPSRDNDNCRVHGGS